MQEWKEATAFTSSATAMAMHPAYQRIIGMGDAALPLDLPGTPSQTRSLVLGTLRPLRVTTPFYQRIEARSIR